MAKLEAGMTRDEAFALLKEHNTDPFHIEHGETVEQTMRYFAREYDPENEEFWGIVGLLHDLDWEEHDDEPRSTPSTPRRSSRPPAARPSLSAPSKATRPTSTPICRNPSCRWRRSCSPPRS